jgi:hypothetical protein
VVRGSWFVVRGSWFVVRGSWFVVRGSWFVSATITPMLSSRVFMTLFTRATNHERRITAFTV